MPENAHFLLLLGRLNKLAIAFGTALELISTVAERYPVAFRMAQRDRGMNRGIASPHNEDVAVRILRGIIQLVRNLG